MPLLLSMIPVVSVSTDACVTKLLMGFLTLLLPFSLLNLAVRFSLEQPMYNVSENSGTLSVCAVLVEGRLAREVTLNLSYQDISTEGMTRL